MSSITHEISTAVAALSASELVAMPTETVYGLAADATNLAAVAKVFALKGRPATNPLIVHVAESDWVNDWADAISDDAQKLMAAFWPGSLTLILPAKPSVSRVITAGQDTVAVRMPNHPQALALLQAFGRAVVAPSANKYMSISPTSSAHVAKQFANDPLLILEGGECAVGLESTILAVLPNDVPRLLRPGMVSVAAIEAVLGKPVETQQTAGVVAPGQHHRHYAPSIATYLYQGQLPQAVLNDRRNGFINCGAMLNTVAPQIDLSDDPERYAKGLYNALYQLDHQQLQAIYVQQPPMTAPWLAVHNRLSRAAVAWTES